MARAASPSMFTAELLAPAIADSFRKLDPRTLVRNPVMFVTGAVALLVTVMLVSGVGGGSTAFKAQLGTVKLTSIWFVRAQASPQNVFPGRVVPGQTASRPRTEQGPVRAWGRANQVGKTLPRCFDSTLQRLLNEPERCILVAGPGDAALEDLAFLVDHSAPSRGRCRCRALTAGLPRCAS